MAGRAFVRLAALSAISLAIGVTAAVTQPARGAPTGSRIDGFTAAHSAAERQAETEFLKLPSTSLAQELDAYLADKTGVVGTSGDRRRVDYVVDKLRSWGLHPKVATYYPYVSSPAKVSLSLTEPTRQALPNKEPCYSFEHDCANELPGYNALSPSGDITAPVVYVNYGTIDDYAVLAQNGISVQGKIVLARYGKVFRGVKTNLAAEHGAIGAVLYSDPADDGNTKGAVYPDGPWRSPEGIQRGSVQELWKYGGDPLTPGYPATKNAPRIDPANANLARIPTTPIGYGAATPVLKNLSGPTVPKSWQGGLPFSYHFGAGPATLHVDLKINYKVTPIWDVTAEIPGRNHPEQTVYVGAHRDSWTYGSDDNLSGAESVLQLGRAFATMMKSGWRPERTIKLATWDGEEYGLFGSTEYAEDQGSRLNNAVAYINMDIAAGKDFDASGMPSLDHLLYDTTKEVDWPGTKGTIYDSWSAANEGKQPTVSRLGSGSDYTAFIDHYGVPAVDIGSSTPSGDYHCSCDNYYMESHYIDPGWHYHKAIAQEVGLFTMRVADADVAPLRYSPYAGEVGDYLTAFAGQEQQQLGDQPVDVQRDIAQAKKWQLAAQKLQEKADRLLAAGAPAAAYAPLNRRLAMDERALLTGAGLPTRPWYRHQIYAPGINQGYGTQKLPGLNDALFLQHDPALARQYERRLYSSLVRATADLST